MASASQVFKEQCIYKSVDPYNKTLTLALIKESSPIQLMIQSTFSKNVNPATGSSSSLPSACLQICLPVTAPIQLHVATPSQVRRHIYMGHRPGLHTRICSQQMSWERQLKLQVVWRPTTDVSHCTGTSSQRYQLCAWRVHFLR